MERAEKGGLGFRSQNFLDIVKDVVAVLAIQAAEVAKNRATHAVHYAQPTGFNPAAFGYQYGGEQNHPMRLAGSSLSAPYFAAPPPGPSEGFRPSFRGQHGFVPGRRTANGQPVQKSMAICKSFMEGKCTYGRQCRYVHPDTDTRAATANDSAAANK